MKSVFLRRISAILLCATCLLTFLTACKKENSDGSITEEQSISYEALTLSEYVRLGTYKGLTVSVSSDDETKADAVWKAVRQNCEIVACPEEQIAYYAAQTRAKYRYYAKENNLKYEEVLSAFHTSEEKILAEARNMVEDDLVFYAVTAAENITLTEEEVTRLFDKYVQKYVTDYGYTREYVSEHLRENIRSSMLYDKVTEFLITNNSFSHT